MKVFLSNTVHFLLEKEIENDVPKTWIYFGSDQGVLKRLSSAYNGKAEEVDFGEKLYQKSQMIRSDFVQWLDEISVPHKDNPSWMFSAPAVRNTYSSKLFLNLNYYHVLRDYVDEKLTIDHVIVDSPALAALIHRNFPDQAVDSWANSIFSILKNIAFSWRCVLRFFRYLLDYGLRFICAKVVFRKRARDVLGGKKDIVLMRNFITKHFSDSDNDLFERHYFPGLYSFLEEKGYVPVFIPLIIGDPNYFYLYKRILNSRKRILVFEEILSMGDYVFAFSVPFRAIAMSLRPEVFNGINVGNLLREDFLCNSTSAEILYSALLSRFGLRLKERDGNPLWIVNWAENQSHEKGLIKGLKNEFPEMKVLGAQSFIVPPNYLAPVYSRQEELYGILPDRILALGPLWKQIISAHVNGFEIKDSPSFRYRGVTAEEPVNIQGDDLMVLLGINQSNSVCMLSILLHIYKSISFVKNILIKLHPASAFNKEKLESIIGEKFPESFKFVGGKLEEYYDKASIGLCGASGTAVELVMKGIPVVTIGETHTLTMNYLESKEDDDIWQICFSADQVLKALKHFNDVRHTNADLFVQKAHEFRAAYMETTDEKTLENCCFVEQ